MALETLAPSHSLLWLGVAAPLLLVPLARAHGAAATPVRGAPGEVVAIDVAKTKARISGGVRAWKASGPEGGTLEVRLRGSMLRPPDKAGELLFDLKGTGLDKVPWSNRTKVSAELRVSAAFVGDGKRNWARAHRARLFVVDGGGRRAYLPNISIVDRPKSTDGWLALSGLPTGDVPMPIGFQDEGFDAARVRGLGVNVEAFNREGEVVEGSIELRGLRVAFTDVVEPRTLASDPAIVAGEAARAARMRARLADRCGLVKGGMVAGVNLAWPMAKAPNGDEMQLYGKILDAGERWYDKLWDIGTPEVAARVREDFAGIRATFGKGAAVRLWLFGDLRSGLVFDAAGVPTGVSERARANMKILLEMAVAAELTLVPVLLDFGLADGVSQAGPDGAWKVGERPELITDAKKRAALVAVFEGFVKPFANHPAILAWDVMNEPENAVAVVTPAHFGDLQITLRDLVDAVHRAGDLATIGHHNVIDPHKFFRGRIATDLGQVHYYPFLETRPNPTRFDVKLGPTFGPVPAGWGELQAFPGKIAGQVAAARRAGHELFWFWAWRGHEESADGFAVKPYAEEIKRALASVPGHRP